MCCVLIICCTELLKFCFVTRNILYREITLLILVVVCKYLVTTVGVKFLHKSGLICQIGNSDCASGTLSFNSTDIETHHFHLFTEIGTISQNPVLMIILSLFSQPYKLTV
jgi:hypothetical protein